MIYELVGTRVVSPYLGASTYIWTSIIGVVLASLSIGYWWGGKWADDRPALGKLAPLFAMAAILVAATGWLSDIAQWSLSLVALPIELKAVLCALFLFAPAATLLGVISPYITRLHLQTMETAGKQIGKMSAFSTLGSIAGTFLAGFVLIPLLGTEHLLQLIAVALAILSVVCFLEDKKEKKLMPLLVVLTGIVLSREAFISASPQIDIDTAYSRVKISEYDEAETGKKVVELSTGLNEAQSAMYLANDEYVFSYTKMMDVFSVVQPDPKSALILGGAGYTVPQHLLKWPSTPQVTVVEIDPGMTALARQYFRLQDDPRLSINHEDARTFLQNSTNTYDVIMVDVFSHAYGIPFHILTEESMQEFRRNLSENGVIVTNVIGAPQGQRDELVGSVVKTFQTQFAHVELFIIHPDKPTAAQNVIVLATNAADGVAQLETSGYKEFWLQQPQLQGRVLTDDYSPMEALARAQWN